MLCGFGPQLQWLQFLLLEVSVPKQGWNSFLPFESVSSLENLVRKGIFQCPGLSALTQWSYRLDRLNQSLLTSERQLHSTCRPQVWREPVKGPKQ